MPQFSHPLFSYSSMEDPIHSIYLITNKALEKYEYTIPDLRNGDCTLCSLTSTILADLVHSDSVGSLSWKYIGDVDDGTRRFLIFIDSNCADCFREYTSWPCYIQLELCMRNVIFHSTLKSHLQRNEKIRSIYTDIKAFIDMVYGIDVSQFNDPEEIKNDRFRNVHDYLYSNDSNYQIELYDRLLEHVLQAKNMEVKHLRESIEDKEEQIINLKAALRTIQRIDYD